MTIRVMAENGHYKIEASPKFWGGLTVRQRRAVIYHEVAHIWRGDLVRIQAQDLNSKAWNIIADAAINRLLPDVPPGGVSFSKLLSVVGKPPHLAYNEIAENLSEILRKDIWIDGPRPIPVDKFDPLSEEEEEVWPVPRHLRDWLKERWVWKEKEKEEEGGSWDLDPRGIDVIDHTKERSALKDALSKSNLTPSDLPVEEREGDKRGGKGAGEIGWSPREKKIMNIHVALRKFAECHKNRRDFARTWRRNGRTDLIRGSVLDPKPSFGVFLDMSGSTSTVWEEITALARGLQKLGGEVFVFDDSVRPWDLKSQIKIGGGTMWAPIAKTMKEKNIKAAVIVTDGYFCDDVVLPLAREDIVFIITPGGKVPGGVNAMEWPR